MLKGQFLFSTCHEAGMISRATIRNTWRDTSQGQPRDLVVGLEIYRAGKLLYTAPSYGTVKPNGYLRIEEKEFESYLVGPGEFLFRLVCQMPKDGPKEIDEGPEPDGILSQECQLDYQSKTSGHGASLLYDLMPLLNKPMPSLSPVVLLAPKVWISKTTNTYLLFSFPDPQCPRSKISDLEILAFSPVGQLLKSKKITLEPNSSLVLSCAEFLKDEMTLPEKPTFLSFIARGAGPCAIMTLIKNGEFGCALEHSLPPHYYSSGNRAEIRQTVIEKNWKVREKRSA